MRRPAPAPVVRAPRSPRGYRARGRRGRRQERRIGNAANCRSRRLRPASKSRISGTRRGHMQHLRPKEKSGRGRAGVPGRGHLSEGTVGDQSWLAMARAVVSFARQASSESSLRRASVHREEARDETEREHGGERERIQPSEGDTVICWAPPLRATDVLPRSPAASQAQGHGTEQRHGHQHEDESAERGRDLRRRVLGLELPRRVFPCRAPVHQWRACRVTTVPTLTRVMKSSGMQQFVGRDGQHHARAPAVELRRRDTCFAAWRARRAAKSAAATALPSFQ